MQINALMICSAGIDKQLVFLKLEDSNEELGSVVDMVVKAVYLEKPKKLKKLKCK